MPQRKKKRLVYPFRNDSVPDYYNRVAHIRESCKIFYDVSKSQKDSGNKTLENEFAKSYRDFQNNESSRIGHVLPTFLDRPSILRSTIDEMANIQESIEKKRKKWFEECRLLAENAKETQVDLFYFFFKTKQKENCFEIECNPRNIIELPN